MWRIELLPHPPQPTLDPIFYAGFTDGRDGRPARTGDDTESPRWQSQATAARTAQLLTPIAGFIWTAAPA